MAPRPKTIILLIFTALAPGLSAASAPRLNAQTPTPPQSADRFEPNFVPELASPLSLNRTYDGLNFQPLDGPGPDNDYYKVWIKPGLDIRCETSSLDGGADTNLIVFDQNLTLIGGNDDVAAGDFRSRVNFQTTYEGWIYVLVGQVSTVFPGEGHRYIYSLRCGLPATATPGPPGAQPTGPVILVRAIGATPTPASSQTIAASLTAVYDANDNHSAESGEAIVGLTVYLVDDVNGTLLYTDFTDSLGQVSFPQIQAARLRVVLPQLHYSVILTASRPRAVLLISPGQSISRLP